MPPLHPRFRGRDNDNDRLERRVIHVLRTEPDVAGAVRRWESKGWLVDECVEWLDSGVPTVAIHIHRPRRAK